MIPPHAGTHHARIVLVDDHPLFLDGIAQIVDTEPDLTLVGTASSAATALPMIRATRPDIVILDINLPDASGFDVVDNIVAEAPDTRILMLSAHDEVQFQRNAYNLGAHGYLFKACSRAELCAAIRTVQTGQLVFTPEALADRGRGPRTPPPTRRELEVLRHVHSGLSNKEIAAALFISERTVHFHVSNLLTKMGASSRTQAAARARELGWISD